MIYKPFSPVHASWLTDDQRPLALYTSTITSDQVPEPKTLRATPGISQEQVEKSYELRLTMIGQHSYAAKILSQDSETGKLDWRAAYHEIEVVPTTVPENILDSCQGVMKDLGIVFGCFDFIVTPEGRYIFLEVNESGQFLWIERYTELPLLDTFTEFLIQGKSDFSPSRNRPKVKYEDIYSAARRKSKQASKKQATS